ncbi:hypothetical protein [Frankia gtarii]|uniref:hypothetical protein n=1 Tax=Frankia gtarii TaxID=2950102 RepID=UPI0021BF2C21|nr:hypothetical protein [Frankia gtarii]
MTGVLENRRMAGTSEGGFRHACVAVAVAAVAMIATASVILGKPAPQPEAEPERVSEPVASGVEGA